MARPCSETLSSSLRRTDRISSHREHESRGGTFLLGDSPGLPLLDACPLSPRDPLPLGALRQGTQNRGLQARPQQRQVGKRPETPMLKNHTARGRAGTQIQTSEYLQDRSE